MKSVLKEIFVATKSCCKQCVANLAFFLNAKKKKGKYYSAQSINSYDLLLSLPLKSYRQSARNLYYYFNSGNTAIVRQFKTRID